MLVEHGLFLNMVDTVIVGNPDGPRILTQFQTSDARHRQRLNTASGPLAGQ